MTNAKSLTDECYETLKGMLTRCEIQPGTRFTEKSLIEKTGFGRTPVREALARLVYDGLVETLPRSGYRTTDINAKAVADLFDIWRVVGPLVARRGSERITPDLLEELDSLVERLVGKSRSVEDWLDAIDGIFSLLARATGNRDLMFLFNRLRSNMRRLYALFLKTPAGQEWRADEYRRWSGGISWLRDPDVAAASMSLAIATSQQGIMAMIGDGCAREAP